MAVGSGRLQREPTPFLTFESSTRSARANGSIPRERLSKKCVLNWSDVPKTALHDPGKLSAAIKELRVDYPELVVDYKKGRERALKAFKALD